MAQECKPGQIVPQSALAGYGLPQPPVGPRQSGNGSSKTALPGT
jgi:hypothetical protein